MEVIYIKETEEICNIVEKILLKIKKFLNIIKVEKNNTTIFYLPIFRESKISKYKTKRIANNINKLLEKESSTAVVLSEYLNNNQLLKNYLYNENINILDGRCLFKRLSCEILKYIFKIKNRPIELRRSFFIS